MTNTAVLGSLHNNLNTLLCTTQRVLSDSDVWFHHNRQVYSYVQYDLNGVVFTYSVHIE